MIFRLGELFSGPGGIAWGAINAGPIINDGQIVLDDNGMPFEIEHLWAVDRDQDSVDTYISNICPDSESSVHTADVVDFFNEDHFQELENCTALAFGFPCNDYSLVGEQRGINGDFGSLYQYGIEVLNQHAPDWFIAENVSGIRSANDRQAFPRIIDEMRHAGLNGYNLTIHKYRFEDYGIAQQRHRIIIVGIANQHNLTFQVPRPTTADTPVSVQHELADIPIDATHQKPTRHPVTTIERLQFTPPGKNAWYLDRLYALDDELIVDEILTEIPDIQERIPDINLDDIVSLKERIDRVKLHCTRAKMSHIYKRLTADRPSYTVTGSGGGGTHVYHWNEPRALTNRERARIQSFPDSFIFSGGKESIRKQIGMAVPPRGVKVIFEAVLKTFAGIEYESIPSNIDM